MFEPTSRYYNIENSKFKKEPRQRIGGQDETFIVYKKRRFLPPLEKGVTGLLAEIAVTAGDRLDLIAVQTLGDPEQYWRICDVNDRMHPLDLTTEPRMILKLPPLPGI